METESLAKIAIRGKGSVKEGKGRSDAAHTSNQEEDLHCLIMADTEEKVNKAKKLIHNVIETVRFLSRNYNFTFQLIFQAASIPEGQNELKRNQLRELAALNGTLRDDENQACQNCEFSVEFKVVKLPNIFQADKSVIVNTTALNNVISRRTSFAVFAGMLAIWPGTVQIDSVEQIGAMMHQDLPLVARQLDELVEAMRLTENTRWVHDFFAFGLFVNG